ncbi:hypothetical protein LR48_Vigan03g217100 [Vigna angularis]|uniref:CCHC-type domain-containing protein n=1 Tax=Phaseolus angularis TaxID=3914 RepID=A0A0L9U8I6_PHAAN|nr:hypothetical protein LR48_Vigan03g217100 [Vigna angularis]
MTVQHGSQKRSGERAARLRTCVDGSGRCVATVDWMTVRYGLSEIRNMLARVEQMTPRPFSQPTNRDATNHTRLLESVIEALRQQNAALTELSLECFRQHHPAKFTEKCLPDEVERTQVLEKSVTELEYHKGQQQQTIRGAISSRNNDNPRKTPYDRSVLPSVSGRCQSKSLVTVSRSRQKKTVKCFECGGPHFRSTCSQLLGVKSCIHCGRNGHLKLVGVFRPRWFGADREQGSLDGC